MKKKKGILLTVIGLIGIIGITVGVTYAFFNYVKEGTTDNTITTSTITFLYTEIDKVGAGISIHDSYPISDSQGKMLSGTNEVFDFKITSTTPNTSSIPYEITARKNSESTLDEKAVKLYLTKVTGTSEKEVLLSKYSDLTQTSKVTSDKYIEKTIYTGKVPADSNNYEQAFKLRMWISSDTDFSGVEDNEGNITYPYNDKEFTITVNVYANAKVVTEEEILDDSSTEISNLSVNGVELISVENKSYDYEIKLPEGTTETIINVESKSEYATVTVENIGDSLTYSNSSNIVRLSSKKTVHVEERYNYFKITVTSLDNKIEEYILKIKVLKTYDNIVAIRNSFKENEKDNVLACEYDSEKEKFIDCDYYNQLGDAFDSKNDGYVVLENNLSVIETTVVGENKNAILDLNGYILNSNDNINIIKNFGLLTIEDSKGTGKIVSLGQVLNNSGNGTLIINNGYFERISGIGTVIYNEETGVININNGQFVNVGDGSAVQNGLSDSSSAGIIYINGGIYISNNHSAILNYTGTTNIDQQNKPIYMTSLAQKWKPVINILSGNININASQADYCDDNYNNTKNGLCVYAQGNGVASSNTGNGAFQNSGDGTVNINGGTFFGKNQGINNAKTGTLNIKNAAILSDYYALFNNGTGNINICSGSVKSSNYDIGIGSNSTGKIRYSKSVKFINDNNLPVISGNSSVVISNYTGTCGN